jgi:hypothetical protein
MAKKLYTITLGGFTSQEGETPLEATKRFVEFLKGCNLNELIYDLVDDETGEKFSVDLSENDEDATQTNNDEPLSTYVRDGY